MYNEEIRLKNNIKIEIISQALLEGFEDGLCWEYKKKYAKNNPLWIEYYYAYIIGLLNIQCDSDV